MGKDRKRSRSRSPKRSRKRSRSREDRRDKDKKHRSRSRSRDRHRDRGDRNRDGEKRPHDRISREKSASSSSPSDMETGNNGGGNSASTTRSKVSASIPTGPNINPVVDSSITIETYLKMEPRNELIDAQLLEDEMEKRKKRIEFWRQQRKLQLGLTGNNESAAPQPKGKEWSLEDDADDEDNPNNAASEATNGQTAELEPMTTESASNNGETAAPGDATVTIETISKPADVDPPVQTADTKLPEKPAVVENKPVEEEEEIDPLDAYMIQVHEDVKKLKSVAEPEPPKKIAKQEAFEPSDEKPTTSKYSVITKILVKPKSGTVAANKKGELLEQNADAVEYSDESEPDEAIEASLAKLNQRKLDLIAVDHSKIEYGEFRKCFYKEVPEIVAMTSQDVERLRQQMDGIRVKGKQVPKPILTWPQCGISLRCLDTLKKHGFEKPTPIQSQAIPIIMSGRDMIGIAKTGSGKTLAFLIPMLRHIEDQPHLEEGDGPIAVVLAPTRELALQITKECRKFSKTLGIRAVCVYGGTGISEQIAELKRGSEIVVCTPGRMIDMLAVNSGKVTNLRRCTYVVIDEADRMFDLGFEPQVMRIVESVRPDRQTVMFSATFPRQMEALARRLLTRPVEVQVGGRSVVCSDVEQHVVILEEHQKFLKLLELLGLYQEQGSVIVFVERQEGADELMRSLLRHSYPCLSLHGGIDQYDRDSILTDFREGNIRLLVATSIAARGLDIRDMILVVNYDCPNHYEDYVHRCGRTGRAGNKGYAWTFLAPGDAKHSGEIMRALEASGAEVSDGLKKFWNDYKTAMEAEGKTVKSSSGFGGHGFRFDQSEDSLRDEQRKAQKVALGLQDSDDEAEMANAIDDKIENMFANSTRRITDRVVAKQAPVPVPVNVAMSAKVAASSKEAIQQKLEMARMAAAKVEAKKVLGIEVEKINQHAAAAIFSGDVLKAVSAKTMAQQMAEQINAKLGYQKEEEKPESEGAAEQCRYYEEEIEINDLPQQIRFRLTSRDILGQVSEYADCGVSVKGTYYPPGKEPKETEPRKLYVHIEATSEMAVSKARSEIKRVIKEELVRMQQMQLNQLSRGRFRVF